MLNNFDIVLNMLLEGKDYFTSIELLNEEAATVARDDIGYQFMIYPEPLGNPSFHVKYKNEWEVVLSLKNFKILESKFGKFHKGTNLPNKIMNKIYEVLKEKNSLDVLVWHFMRYSWNINNPKYQIEVKKEIPIL